MSKKDKELAGRLHGIALQAVENLREERDRLEQELDDLKEKLEDTESKIKDIENEKVSELREQLRDADETIEERNEELTKIEAEAGRLSRELSSRREKGGDLDLSEVKSGLLELWKDEEVIEGLAQAQVQAQRRANERLREDFFEEFHSLSWDMERLVGVIPVYKNRGGSVLDSELCDARQVVEILDNASSVRTQLRRVEEDGIYHGRYYAAPGHLVWRHLSKSEEE